MHIRIVLFGTNIKLEKCNDIIKSYLIITLSILYIKDVANDRNLESILSLHLFFFRSLHLVTLISRCRQCAVFVPQVICCNVS